MPSKKIANKLEEDKSLNEHEIRKAEKSELHKAMGEQVHKRKHRLEHAAYTGDTAKLWDLIAAAMEWFGTEGALEVDVVTQGRNLAAQRLYQRNGFVTRRFELLYHKWFAPEDDQID